VEGYGMPVFYVQVALAYNPQVVRKAPRSFADLVIWITANPGQFGYNGVRGGLTGTAFVAAWLYWKTGQYQQYALGPYDNSRPSPLQVQISRCKRLQVSSPIIKRVPPNPSRTPFGLTTLATMMASPWAAYRTTHSSLLTRRTREA
jgi:hypothetical protein